MEVYLQVQRPFCSRTISSDRAKIKPFLGFFSCDKTSQCSQLQYSSWHKEFPVVRVSYRISASSDFSRKRPRKFSNPRPKGSTSKGFIPKTQVGMSTQKQDQRSNGEKGSGSPISSEYAGPNKATLEMKLKTDEEQSVGIRQAKKVEEESEDEIDRKVEELSSMRSSSADAKVHQLADNGRIGTVDEDVTESQKTKTILKNVSDGVEGTGLEGKHLDVITSDAVEQNESMGIDESQKTKTIAKNAVGDAVDRTGLEGKNLDIIKSDDVSQNKSKEIAEDITKNQSVKPESVKEADKLVSKEKDNEDSSLKLKLEMEANVRKQEMEANVRKQVLERLAEENFLKGKKMFNYPEVVKPDQNIGSVP
ncbi:hypothetical protein F0562_014327 [Nyssa sinensis]|uniref:Uncharacterized protein n=1 Tax=Nyssa sinensis TaxID=561372 RepID=A0A5J4ZSN9_9ASTE|nr:hypothetical protein F0562_014327 [Nyssa sinensis]